MTPERWQQIKSLLHSALERDPADRAAFLNDACAGNRSLQSEVEALITSAERAEGFIESPAVEVMAGTLANDHAESMIGQVLDHYLVLEQLGAGGMGEVYLAEDTRLVRKVALKALPAHFTRDDELVRRFQQEARAVSALNHPNIVTIHQIGEVNSRHFIVTEFIEGETLGGRLRRGRMKTDEALDVAVQVASALCAAHQAGIVHRDIKPENIMLRSDGIVKVLDFGLAMLAEHKGDDLEADTLIKTKPGIIMGSAHYMSPEQARGQTMDARTDIFSLGVVLYQMASGRVPFAGQTMTDVLASIVMLEPPLLSESAPEAPQGLQGIVDKALRKEKDDRYQTAADLLADIKLLKQRLIVEAGLGQPVISDLKTSASAARLEQEIQFCTTADGVRIAYSTVGAGPPLVKAANWLNHLEFDWQSPIWRHVIEEFARDHLLVRYDERGNGLSDWDVENFTFEAFVQDLATVVDTLGMDRFPILGISQGGPVAIAYAVRYPERVSHLILYGSYARGWANRGVPEVIERWNTQKTLIKLGWGQDNPAFRQLWSTLYAPDATPEQWQWFNELHKISTSADNAIRLLDELGRIDVVDLLPQVKVPTLVLHCRDEAVVPFEEGRLVAAKIPGARFVPLEGRNHLLLEHEPAWPRFVTEVRRFLETDHLASKSFGQESPSLINRKTLDQPTLVHTKSNEAIRTGEILSAESTLGAFEATAPITSGAEYFLGWIKQHRMLAAALAAIVVLLLAGLGYSYLTASSRTIDSLAVLPFINVGGDPNTEYLSDGIAESIIYSTSQLSDLKVTPRSSVFRYKGKEVDPQTVGRELGVSAIMTGKVTQRGDDLTISAELVDLRDNRLLWGRQYNRKIGDILAVQEEISRDISETLRVRVTGEEQKRLTKRYTENTEAYRLYLKGRYYWNKRTAEGYQRGIDHFRQAIEKDPNYALAWTGLADCYMLIGRFGVVPPKESMPKAKAAAIRALEIDDELAEAHTSLGYIKKEYDWDFQGAEAELKRALQLNPNYPTAIFWHALFLSETLGKHDEALAKIERAQELEPLSLIMSTDRGMILYLAHRYDPAIEYFHKTLDMDPNFFRAHLWLGRAYEQKGMYKEAVEEFQKARQLDDKPFVLAALGHVFAASGRRSDAQQALNELSQLSKRMYVDSYQVAAIHAALGDKDQAFQSLEKAYDDRSSWLSRIKVDPLFDSLHSDPRFKNLVQRIGLP